MVAAIVLDGWPIDRAFRRAMFPKKSADFFAFGGESKLSFTLCPATLA
jgi:hypothetical protein